MDEVDELEQEFEELRDKMKNISPSKRKKSLKMIELFEEDEKEITPLWIYYDSYSAKYWVEEMKNNGFKMERCIQGAKTLSLPMQQLGAYL